MTALSESIPALLITQVPALVLLLANIVQARLLNKRSFAMAEFAALERTCSRLREENKTLNQEVGMLKERTDLQPVIELLRLHNQESNTRFDRALQIQAQQSELQRQQSQLLEANTKAIEGLTHSHQQVLKHLFPAVRKDI